MADQAPDASMKSRDGSAPSVVVPPQISLPKGGGAIHGMGEKFGTNPVNGTGSLTIPITTSPGRSGFGPHLALSYDSGSGNGSFGLGWSLSLPAITRKTDKGLPRYQDRVESDVFMLSGAEDLVPVLVDDGFGNWVAPVTPPRDGYRITSYRPRVEGLFSRIERWAREIDGDTHWRTLSKDNVTTVYGATSESRIANPDDQTQVFSWLLSQTHDDKGNVVVYDYASEDSSNIDLSQPAERNRSAPGRRSSNRYLTRIRYGNTPSLLVEADIDKLSWLFEVVLDYGEGYLDILPPDPSGRVFASATLAPAGTWPARQDPFSQYRAGFEIRTYRLCRRVLMVHHFPDELGTVDCLVRSTDFDYREDQVASFMTSVSQSGYVRQADGRYLRSSLPKLEMSYSQVRIDETVHDVDAQSLDNLPSGADGSNFQWIDFDSEGLTGVLSEQAGAWFYKRALGDGTFGPIERVALKPSFTALSGGRQHLVDLSGEGRLDLVQYDGPAPGFNARTADGGWEGLRPFRSLPNINTRDPNLRFVDVTGDGWPDILISGDRAFSWYESLAKDGFAPERLAQKSWDEEAGPALVFADATQSIFLADMVGDGLSDIVRIRYAEVCYWPNLGYGRFGAKVTMGQAPVFECAELFDPRRLRLADIDGSGNADIVYAGHDGIVLYFNRSGNSWSPPHRLAHFPGEDSLTSVTVADLKGNGTACLVWSSPTLADARRPMRFIDLMGGQKPHLLVGTRNNMGSETDVQYAASTKFYLQDRREGRPWLTKLPFPVHVVERVESRDLVSDARLVSSFRYRHGYFDGVEREFHGFAFVEQRDAEHVVGQFDLPPIVTRTWFHNGAFLEDRTLEAAFSDPASGEYFTGDPQAVFLEGSQLPDELAADETREAARALKGSILRQEIYADDGSAVAGLPYSVSEHSYRLTRLQGLGPNRHAVFFSHLRETIDYHYERNPADPRISHSVTLAVDGYGNVLRSASLGYRRRAPEFAEQDVTLATLTENQYTSAIDDDDAHRTPLPSEVRTYELTAPVLAGAAPLDFATVEATAAAATEIAYEAQPAAGLTEKRLVERVRTLYRADDLTGFLPLGTAASMALPGERYRMALTPGLFEIFKPKAPSAALAAILAGPEAGYRDLDGDGHFWIPSGQVFHSQNPGDTAAAELAFAQAHFFLPHRFQDPFGASTTVAYDPKYVLTPMSTEDAVGNVTLARQDYRVLQPALVTDPNGNRALAGYDALGMLSGVAMMGKATGTVEGDSFGDFATDLAPADIRAFFNAADPRPLAATALGTATTRLIYDLEHIPVCAASVSRETHVADLAPGQQSKTRLLFCYSDGFGREAQTKAQAEPGPLDPGNPASPVIDPRWIGTGAKTFNNKGKPIRQYEPFFSATPAFGIETWGVSNTLFYDPMERVVATLHPNNAFEKTVVDPWCQVSFDVNDTVAFDPKTDLDCGEFFSRLPDADYLPTWYQKRIAGALGPDEQAAAVKAAQHADTPAIAHFDSLGRSFLTLADNGKDSHGVDQQYGTRTSFDIEGKPRQVADAKGRVATRSDYDMHASRLHHATMDGGERWTLNDASGKPIRAWNSRGYAFRYGYDALHRPLSSFVVGGDPTEQTPQLIAQEILCERTVYGESPDTGLTVAQQQQANLRGKLYQHYDGAGISTTERYDFKGNALSALRQFASVAAGAKSPPDWSQNPALEGQTFASATAYDALNRAIASTAPDGSIYRPTFSEANLLASVDVNIGGAQLGGHPVWTPFVTSVDHDAKGQRRRIAYANGAATAYDYDPETFRLVRMRTTRPAGLNSLASSIFLNDAVLQDLHYTYDAVGNITRINDAALLTVFNAGQQVDPACDYSYDPLYRLIEARGREHVGQSAFAFAPAGGSDRDYPFVGAAQLGDLRALRNYTERYEYDPVGNFQTVAHLASGGNWTRTYSYQQVSLIEPGALGNRLTQTALQTNPAAPVETYAYDAHGNVARMPHLQLMQWNFKDEIAATARQAVIAGQPETTYYTYDSGGQRLRKLTERQNGARKNERFYLGGFEIYREFDAVGGVTIERQTLHVLDDKQRIALIETQTAAGGSPVVRYQLGNHLSSASLELDPQAALISYEEYSPYGNSTLQAGRSAAETSLKRYRYTGKERDEESGFSYHKARHCASWLGRWISCDPAESAGSDSPYAYGADNPLRFVDPEGASDEDLVGNLLSDVSRAYNKSKLKIKAFAQEGEVAKYWKQGASQYEDAVNQVGRLTEAEHPLAGEALKFLNKKFSYSAATTVVIKRPIAVAKTVGDIRLIKGVKSGAIAAAEFVQRSKANFVKAIATRWAQTGESTVPQLVKDAEQAAIITDQVAVETLPVLSKIAAVAKPLAAVAKPVAAVVKPIAVGLVVLSAVEGVASAATPGRSGPVDTATKMEQDFERGEKLVGAAVNIATLVPGPVGLIAGGAQANAYIATTGIHATGGDDRIVAAGKSTEQFAKAHGWTDVNAETAGAVAAATTSIGEGVQVLALASNPIGWGVLAVKVWKKW